MKITRKNAKGESRQLLLKEYFLNAFLIATLKKMGEEAGKIAKGSGSKELAPARIKA